MAANMGMAGNGHLMMQQQQQQNNNNRQRQLQQTVYTALVQNTPVIPGGWQQGIQINDRLGKTMNLISNVILAIPGAEWQKAVSFALDFEKKAFLSSPDRMSYEQQMASKTAEMAHRRQQQGPALQNQLSAEAAARQQQVQAQAQAQQQLMAHQNAAYQAQMGQMVARGMVPPGQQGFQHLRGPMQASPIPQQPPQMGMGTPGFQQPQPNQPLGMNLQQRVGPLQDRMKALNPQQRMQIMERANHYFANQTEDQRQNVRQQVQARMTPQQLAELRNRNQDPLLMWYQNKALTEVMAHRQAQGMDMNTQQQQGMGPNASSAQAAMLQQQQQQLQQQQQKQQMAMNTGGLMNNMGPGMPGGQLFGPNMETIINEQKAGLLAEQSGQIVVPASNGANRNGTGQPPIGGVGAQSMPNSQPGPNQNPRSQQIGQPFNLSQVKMNQAAAQSAAQSKAQAAAQQMQGQPGGLAGSAPTSQSPAMNTLNAPMTQPPVAIGGVGQVNGGRFNPGNPAMGQGLDQRFNHQANIRPISMSGNINVNSAALNQMLSALPADKRPNVNTMPPDKLRELIASWEQRNNIANGLMPQQPTPGQLQMGQMGNQFTGNAQQTPNPNVQNNSQQAMMRARISAQAIAGNPQAQLMMDSMDLPPTITQRLLRNGIPPDTKQWGQLKRWMQELPLPQGTQHQLMSMQLNQFREMMEKRQAAAAANGALGGGPPQQQPAPQAQPQQPGPVQQLQQNLNLPPGFRIPPQALAVSPADLQTLRNDARFANLDDQNLHKVAVRLKQESFLRRLQAERLRKQQQDMQQQQLGNGNPFAPPQQQQGAVLHSDMPNPLQTPSQQPAQKPTSNSVEPTAAGAKSINSNVVGKLAQNRPPPPNPSPAAAVKNLKRGSPDDVADAPTANNAGEAAPSTGTQPTPQMIASLPPEQRQKWEQHQRRQGNLQPEEGEAKRMGELIRSVANEETADPANRSLPEQQLSATERQDVETRLPQLVLDIQKVVKVISRWYWIAQDNHRLRLFFRMRARILQQFSDDTLTQFKKAFTVGPKELTVFRTLLSTMGQDLSGRKLQPKGPGNAVAPSVPTSTAAVPPVQANAPTPKQAPLNPANLERHTQAMNKAHQRSNSKAGQAPAAPTTTQPPFPFGAQVSPTGQPTYFNKPAVTQETLNPPPPARKKAKTGHQQVSSPALQQSGPSPQVNTASPELKRQPQVETPKAPARPLFVCPDAECDNHSTGFPNQEAVDAHFQEAHVKPYENPLKYLEESMITALGLDAQGQLPQPGSIDMSQHGALAMKPNGSKQGQQLGKPEPTSTPMSRNASMGRQASAQGGKAMDNKGTPGRGAHIKAENTPKPIMQQEPNQAQPPTAEDPWANSTVNPQALMATFAPIQSLANGFMSTYAQHRSPTPNESPDSSKDSGVSEPNSDISEKANLNIDLSWRAVDLDAEIYANLEAVSMGGFGDDGEFPPWHELESEFSKYTTINNNNKPFELDTSLYGMTAL
ncbi:hypothetical protein GE09DRAFT_707372 [Coniochaeta sp. 2T2.1]|nr:hypothetical protein GE09DRAFT_707372 [Coniochaeta sp. 2T2.1]